MENFRPIAMRCTRKQFEAIKPKLENDGCNFYCITNDWGIRCYLVNNHSGEKKQITNIGRGASSYYGRKIYEQWDEDIFLKACGTNSVSYALCVRNNNSDKGFTVGKIYNWPNPIDNDGNKRYISIFEGGIWGFKPSTKEEFDAQNLNKTNKTNKTMEKQKLTVPVTDVIKIHAVACSSWKLTIGDYLKRIDIDQNITFSQKEVDDMFEAATDNQKPVLIQIFGKPASAEIDWSKIKTGSKVRIKHTGEVCNGFSDINPDEPVDVVFFNTPHLINNTPTFKSQSCHSTYCTFHQDGKFVLFSSEYETYKNYITEVVEY